MTDPLSMAEIAAIRDALRSAITAQKMVVVLDALPRLLDEVEKLRTSDVNHVAGEKALQDRIRDLEQRIEALKAELRKGVGPPH